VVQYRMLGPVAVDVDGAAVPIGRPRQRAVLAYLLLHRNTAVPTDRLVQALWDGTAPSTARSQVQTDLSILRRRIRDITGADPVTTTRSGYRITVGPGDLDLDRFTALTRAARAATSPEAAAEHLRDALTQWTGTPLSGISAAYADAHRVHLDEQRLHAYEDLYEAELRAGRHAEIVGEMLALITAYPLRESLVRTLMTALHRSGRTAEALEHARDLRRRLADEHGLDPSRAFHHLEQTIRRDPPESDDTVRPHRDVPRQLPWHLPAIAGRTTDLERLDTVAERGGVAVVTGTAGVGKTTLALHWAHRVADRYPDGQLYANLHGFDPHPEAAQPSDVLGDLLVALGEPARDLPADPDARSARYRSRTSGRRLLIVLDNARDAEQVVPLLPAGGTAAVVITSRDRMTSLVAAGAVAIPLDLLGFDDAADLLAMRLPPGRVADEPDAVGVIVAGCARLPLALSLVAAHAATRPEIPLADTAAALRRGEFDLDGDGAALTATFAWSYARLSRDADDLFVAIGTGPLAEISPDAAASLVGVPADTARAHLAELARASLLTETSDGRMTLHDLLRADARRRADRLGDDPDRLLRLLDHYAHTARRAAILFQPGRTAIAIDPPVAGVTVTALADRHEALAWLRTEQHNLIMLATRAGIWGHDAYAWRLTWSLTDYLHRVGWWHDWIRVQAAGLVAAKRLNEPRPLMLSRAGLARALMQVGRFDDAEDELGEARTAAAVRGDVSGEAYVLQILAEVHGRRGRNEDAVAAVEAALALYDLAGDLRGRAAALNNIGLYLGTLGRTDDAIGRCAEALRLFTAKGEVNGTGAVHDTLGRLHADLGDPDAAIRHFTRSIEIKIGIGERYQAASSLTRIGEVYAGAGDLDAAARAYRQALGHLDDLDHPDAAGVRALLAGLRPDGA
jgi:DNA-binding SARP family transcriptional activator/tetratricopeptide (TPR) repeat protein